MAVWGTPEWKVIGNSSETQSQLRIFFSAEPCNPVTGVMGSQLSHSQSPPRSGHRETWPGAEPGVWESGTRAVTSDSPLFLGSAPPVCLAQAPAVFVSPSPSQLR